MPVVKKFPSKTGYLRVSECDICAFLQKCLHITWRVLCAGEVERIISILHAKSY